MFNFRHVRRVVSPASGVATVRTAIHLLLTYLPCPRSTARLQRSPVGRVESFRSWSSHLFRGRPGGRRHVRSGGRLSEEPCLPVCRRQVEPHVQILRCVDGIGDGTVKSLLFGYSESRTVSARLVHCGFILMQLLSCL